MVHRMGESSAPRPAAGRVFEALPDELRAARRRGWPVLAATRCCPTSAAIRSRPSSIGAGVPSDAAGSQQIELYYAFPFAQEDESLSLIRSTVIISGIALTLFVVGIGVMVTRLVVDPVRRAAGTAQRLAEGQLEQRMTVRGEDDLARLATSFNAMADSLQRQITQLEGLSQLQQRFTSDVSHELRTPLTTVQMAADVLHDARGDFPPHVARSAELLRAELDRFEGLLTDLLEISRYDAGAAVLDSEAVGPRGAGGPGGGRHVVARRTARLRAGGGPARRGRHRRGRRAPGGADPAQPRRQRHRARRGPADRDHPRRQPDRGRDDRPRLRGRAQLGRRPARLRPVLAGRPVARPHRRRQRARAVDQPGGRPPARRLAPGLGPARRRGAVPAHAAAHRRRRPHQLAAAAATGRPPPPRGAA